MDIQRRIDFLINYIRGSRKKFILSIFLVFLFTLFVFLLGAYYLMFHYYEGIIKEYYTSLMRNVSNFQEFLIDKDSYREDLRNISEKLKNNRGVIDVWCSDRYGKLIYHTNPLINEEFSSRRLYEDYYESINHVWNFTNGSPDPNIVSLDKWFIKRYSIPLYVSGSGSYDFVLGMDVKRFIFLPENTRQVILGAAGAFIFALLILFLPAFLWIRSRYNQIISRARVVMGSIELDLAGGKPQAQYEEAALAGMYRERESEQEKVMSAVKTAKEKYREEPADIPAETPAATYEARRAEEIEKEVPPAEPAERMYEKSLEESIEDYMADEASIKVSETPKKKTYRPEDTGDMNPLLSLMEKKQSIFNTEYVDLSFIEAGSFVYHSPGSQGCYFYYNKGSDCHFYTVFDYPEVEPGQAARQLTQLAERLDRDAENADRTKTLLKGLNDYCLENRLEIDVSILMISDFEKKVEYASCGQMHSIYLKNNENDLKDLVMEVPSIGKLSEKEFDESFTYAEIGFVEGDIFALLPKNANDIIVHEESLFELIKRVLLSNRDQSVEEVGLEIHDTFEPVRRKKRSLPETGFAIFKFI